LKLIRKQINKQLKGDRKENEGNRKIGNKDVELSRKRENETRNADGNGRRLQSNRQDVETSPSYGADSCSASQELPAFYWMHNSSLCPEPDEPSPHLYVLLFYTSNSLLISHLLLGHYIGFSLAGPPQNICIQFAAAPCGLIDANSRQINTFFECKRRGEINE
jgi:hypothetical protein